MLSVQFGAGQYSNDLDLAKKKYEKSKHEYNVKLDQLQEKEKNLKQRRTTLGFFAFSKKKELDAKISECQEEMEVLKKSDNTGKLKREYEGIFDKVHSLDIYE